MNIEFNVTSEKKCPYFIDGECKSEKKEKFKVEKENLVYICECGKCKNNESNNSDKQ